MSNGPQMYAGLGARAARRPADARKPRPRDAQPQQPRQPREPIGQEYLTNKWRLTPMQCRIMLLLVAGRTIRQIAIELELSPKTVNVHVERAKEKMEVATALQAALKWDRCYRDHLSADATSGGQPR